MANMLPRHALLAGRLAGLGATRGFTTGCYAPLTRTALFTSYTAGGFSLGDQERLQRVVLRLATRGCRVLLSNSTAPDITRLYDGNPEAMSAGLRAHKVPARRAINSDAAKRGAVLEYLVTNIPRGGGRDRYGA